MPDDDFNPKLGRIRDQRTAKSIRHSTRVIEEVSRNVARPVRRYSHINPNAHRRGMASGAIAASGGWTPGARRVVVRARYVRMTKSNLGPAHAHLRYILRDGTTREGLPGELYDADGRASAEPFLARSKDDPHQFRFIVAPEDSARLANLQPVIRDLMKQMEQDLGTKLDWVAVDHFNTGHPHTHVVVRGRDERGHDLIMARDYISHGIRGRMQDLVTLELGPESELERVARQTNEVGQERLTGLDRGLIARAPENVFVVASSPADPPRHAMTMGRLRKLETLGLAKEERVGVWTFDPQMEPKLRQLGERADKIKMMQRALDAVGLERTPGTYAIFDRGTRKEPLVGKVVGTGLVDEISDRSWLVVDATDGRVHYIEVGRLKPESVPARETIVRIVPDRLSGKPQASPRIDVLADPAHKAGPTYDGPLWLDRIVANHDPSMQTRAGFGASLTRDLDVRKLWLAAQDLGRFKTDSSFELRTSASTQLQQREQQRIGADVAVRTGASYFPSVPGTQARGTVGETIATPTAKLVVIRRDTELTVVPWSKALERHRGKEIAGIVTPHQLMIGRNRARPGVER
jgi:type IV secretory pathway VirD2 relaxase